MLVEQAQQLLGVVHRDGDWTPPHRSVAVPGCHRKRDLDAFTARHLSCDQHVALPGVHGRRRSQVDDRFVAHSAKHDREGIGQHPRLQRQNDASGTGRHGVIVNHNRSPFHQPI